MPQYQSGTANSRTPGQRHVMTAAGGWDTDRWAGVVVLSALGLLILLRMGFRGVGLMGARVSVG